MASRYKIIEPGSKSKPVKRKQGQQRLIRATMLASAAHFNWLATSASGAIIKNKVATFLSVIMTSLKQHPSDGLGVKYEQIIYITAQ